MSSRLLASLGTLVVTGAAVLVTTIPVVSQSQTSTDDIKARERKLIREVAEGLDQKGAKTPAATAVPKNWKPGRTPWGDPDLAGVYSNSEESGIPFEKPSAFGTRRLEDISPQELAELNRAHQDATIERAASASDEPNAHPQLFWWETLNPKNSRAWLVADPSDGKIPPMTQGGQQRVAARAEARRNTGRGTADSYEDRSLYDQCITRGLPGSMMPAIYGSAYEVVQGPGYVGIIYEMIHETRVIPLDAHPHVGARVQTYMGDPRGHWEGNTLVVETTNFKDQSAYRGANGDTLRLIERFKPIGPHTVEWSVTVDDPATWRQPWTFAMNLTKKDESQRPFEYGCHEGNYGLRNILSGARADEAAAADAAKQGKTVAIRPVPLEEER
jgi:hypothetical protein